MTPKLKDKFNKQGFLIVRNVLDFNFDLKPVLNDIEFIMNRLVYKFVSKNKRESVFKYDFWNKYTFLSNQVCTQSISTSRSGSQTLMLSWL